MSISANSITDAVAALSVQDKRPSIPLREPANGPIYTRGNAFWEGENRFLIKGTNYSRKHVADGDKPSRRDPFADVLADESLEILRSDIKLMQEIGLNTVLVSDLDQNKDHRKAMEVLADAGLYVLVKLQVHDFVSNPEPGQRPLDPDSDLQRYYSAETMSGVLRVVNELADCRNIMGFIVSGQGINRPATTRVSEVMRAGVRDIKSFLHRRGGKRVPVGVSQQDLPMLRNSALQYFTAGDSDSRIDFWALNCFSWAHQSSFQISGWKHLVAACEKFPVPMFLSQYGAKVGKIRIWQEVECLYSPDMTGVFSGGCFYTFREVGDGYGIIETDEQGNLVPKSRTEFQTLKKRFRTANKQSLEQANSTGSEIQYESWTGEFPEQRESRWYALSDTSIQFPLDWTVFMEEIAEENQWELVEKGSEVGDTED